MSKLRMPEWLWAPALYAGVVLIFYREVYLGWGGHLRFFGWDCPESYWPDLAYFANALRHGEWPLWNPYDRGGYAFFGDTVVGLYYPVSWVAVGLGALFGKMPLWALQAKVLLHHVALGATTHAYLRSRKLGRPAAVFGGVTAIVSLPMVVHKASALIWPMVWAPLIWIAIDAFVGRAGTAGSWRRAAGLGAAIGLAGLAGPPPGLFYILLPSFAYGALRVVQALHDAQRAGRASRDLLALARGLGLAVAVAGALLAVMLVPAVQVVAESPRGIRTLAYALSNPLPAGAGLRGLVAPGAGVVHAYLGIVLLALLATALVLRPRADRWAPLLFAAMAGFGLLLALGAQTPLLPWLVENVPGFGLFREPHRYKVLAAIVASVVAAHGVEALCRAEVGERRWALGVTLGIAALLALMVLVLRASFPPPAIRPADHVGFGFSLAVLAAGATLAVAAVLAPSRLRPVAATALAAVAYFDVATFGAAAVKVTELPSDDQEDRRFLADLGDAEREWRIYDEFVMEQRPGSRLMIRDFRGYPSGDPFEDVRYQEVLRAARKTPQILEAFNVRWVLHGAHHRNGKSKNFLQVPPSSSAPEHFKMLDPRRYEALHPVALAVWYGGVKLVGKKDEALSALERSEDEAGIRRVAIVERPDIPDPIRSELERLAADTAPPSSVAGQVVSYRGNRVVVEVDAPDAGLVVVNEKTFRGWQVAVDGRPATPVRANYLLRGVIVAGAGRHRIEWTFAPPSYPWLIALWGLAVSFCGVALWVAGEKSLERDACKTEPTARLSQS